VVKAFMVIEPFDSAQGAMTFFALATAIHMSLRAQARSNRNHYDIIPMLPEVISQTAV
jgi:hypothetical protein